VTHFATPPGAYPPAEHELAAIIATETAILQILRLWSLSRPAKEQPYTITIVAPPASGFDAHGQWTR
jgi:hypothetical protein